MNKTKIICLTGKSGTGKSTLAKKIIEENPNSLWLDLDKVADVAREDNIVKSKIVKVCGEEILNSAGEIDKKEMAKVVFKDKKIHDKVYEITWGYIEEYIKQKALSGYDFLILDWYNIVNEKYWNIADFRVILERNNIERKEAVIKRDNITSEYFDLRETRSLDYSKIDTDYIIDISDMGKIAEFLKEIKRKK